MTTEQLSHQAVKDATAATEATMRTQQVPVNMYETTGAVVVVAPLPAVTPDDVTIELKDQCLRFWARLRSAAPRDYLLSEWEYGGYERELDVPAGYGSSVEASLNNGQLAIRILKGVAVEAINVKPNGAL
ncbi:MAG TPA: Hsp20/alpha crystallin family protein [Acidimicrobiales bacterium]|nr:Hsp20/alpha crystallin family protein [Acidimicrobiales bacterium]